MTQQLELRAALNYEYVPDRRIPFEYGGEDRMIFNRLRSAIAQHPAEVRPARRIDAQRVATAQAVLERTQASPLYGKYEAEKMFLRALKVDELPGQQCHHKQFRRKCSGRGIRQRLRLCNHILYWRADQARQLA